MYIVIVTGQCLTWRSTKRRDEGNLLLLSTEKLKKKFMSFFLLCGSILSRKQVRLAIFQVHRGPLVKSVEFLALMFSS